MNHPIRRLNRLHITLGLRMSFIHNKSRAGSAGIVFLRRLRSRNKALNRPRSAFIKADGTELFHGRLLNPFLEYSRFAGHIEGL